MADPSLTPATDGWRVEHARDDAGNGLSIERYLDRLLADGWIYIGRTGGFARVLEKAGVVIKVFRKDPAYLSYLRHVLNRPENRALPRIHDVVEIIGDGERFHHIVLERLDDFAPHHKRNDVTLDEIRDLAYRIAIAEASDVGTFPRTESDRRIEAAMTADEQSALQDIIRIAKNHNFRADLEPWNVMMRGDEMVFTDPLLILRGELGFALADGTTMFVSPVVPICVPIDTRDETIPSPD